MSENIVDLGDTLTHLLALMTKLEAEGQYNIAKLTHAAAMSISRRAAYHYQLMSDKAKLTSEVDLAIAKFSKLDGDPDLIAALQRGADIMAEGRLPMIDETPHAYVCRTCGQVLLDMPSENCPICNAYPATFRRFLPVYWLEALDPFESLEKLQQTPSDVEELLKGLAEEALSRKPEDGGWSIRNIISHLRDAQGVLFFRSNMILDQDDPILESKAVFEWAAREQDRPPTTREIFDTYKTSRQTTIARLKTIPLKDWWRTGNHEEFGIVTLQQQVSYFACHEITHLPQIALLHNQFQKFS